MIPAAVPQYLVLTAAGKTQHRHLSAAVAHIKCMKLPIRLISDEAQSRDRIARQQQQAS